MPISKILHVINKKTGDGAQIDEASLPIWKAQGYEVEREESRGHDEEKTKKADKK